MCRRQHFAHKSPLLVMMAWLPLAVEGSTTPADGVRAMRITDTPWRWSWRDRSWARYICLQDASMSEQEATSAPSETVIVERDTHFSGTPSPQGGKNSTSLQTPSSWGLEDMVSREHHHLGATTISSEPGIPGAGKPHPLKTLLSHHVAPPGSSKWSCYPSTSLCLVASSSSSSAKVPGFWNIPPSSG